MSRPPHRLKPSSFVAHLYDMMNNPMLTPLCGFAPDGKSFYVTDSKDFPEKVLPQVRGNKYRPVHANHYF